MGIQDIEERIRESGLMIIADHGRITISNAEPNTLVLELNHDRSYRLGFKVNGNDVRFVLLIKGYGRVTQKSRNITPKEFMFILSLLKDALDTRFTPEIFATVVAIFARYL
jgi:hypothetical protein